MKLMDQKYPGTAQISRIPEHMMEKAEIKSWFAAQSQQCKNFVLLQLGNELTIYLRDISTTNDKELMLKAGWVVSECQHRILSYVIAAMTGQDRYPDEVIAEIVFDHIEHPALRSRTQLLWESAMDRAERFGTALK